MEDMNTQMYIFYDQINSYPIEDFKVNSLKHRICVSTSIFVLANFCNMLGEPGIS